MMFKRKEARKVSVGDFCVLNEIVKEKLRSSDRYLKDSVCHRVNSYGGNVNSNVFSRFNKRYLLEDVSLFYVKRKSIFGVLELVPLFFAENPNGFLSKKALNDNITMFASSESLDICTRKELDSILGIYYSSIVSNAREYLVEKLGMTGNPFDID